MREASEFIKVKMISKKLAAAILLFIFLIPIRQLLLPKRGMITIWAGLEKSEIEALEKLAENFEKETGISVQVVWEPNIKLLRTRFRIAAPMGRGPDILLGPHDWIGEFVNMKVIAPIPENVFTLENRAKFLDQSINAVTLGDNIWGFPCMLESLVLIYNKDMISEPPTTWDDLIKRAKELTGVKGFHYPHVDPYYSFPILSGYGAYVFGDNENVEDIGLSTTGAIEGGRYIQNMVWVHKILPPDPRLNPYMVREEFVARRAAMIIDGPWAFPRLENMKIDYGVTRLPLLPNGQYPRTFIGVQVCMVNARSENPDAAMRFAAYLSDVRAQRLLHEAGRRIPAHRDVLSEVENRRGVRAVLEQLENGIPMPKVQEMDAVWTPWTNALVRIVQGEDPGKELREAVDAIKREIERMRR